MILADHNSIVGDGLIWVSQNVGERVAVLCHKIQ